MSASDAERVTRESDLNYTIGLRDRQRQQLAEKLGSGFAFTTTGSAPVSQSIAAFADVRPSERNGNIWNSRDGYLASFRQKR